MPRPVAAQTVPSAPETVEPALAALLAQAPGDAMFSVVVELREQEIPGRIHAATRAAQRRQVIEALQHRADQSQRRIKALLLADSRQGSVARFQSFWIFNGLEVTATAAVIQELASMSEVAAIVPNAAINAPELTAAATLTEPNLELVRAPALWALGWRGQGVVVANMDTGVDATHPDLAGNWRGGTNSWFDPYGQHATPADVAGTASGHGTWTMGVIVGGDAGGTAIGVAPDAQWIAAKIFDDQGNGTLSGIHAAFQWLLDPDGDPATDDAPDVVNGSWSYQAPGCNLDFAADLQALVASGIVPVFAAGNGGPGGDTSFSPANNPGALAVGAVANDDSLYAYSSRGPTSCGGATRSYPDLVAPGVAIRSADLYGLYTSATGTSLAAPQVSGALALLLSASPALSPAVQEDTLVNGSLDLGAAGADNDFGHGRLDILAAYQRLSAPRESLYLSASAGGAVAGIAFEDEDILSVDLTTGAWTLLFDGSDVGLDPVNLDALAVLADGSLLFSVDGTVTLAGVGRIGAADIVHFQPASLGANTAGTFGVFLQARDIDLTAKSEDIDALELTVDGKLLVSTTGNASVTGVSARDEDLLAWDAQTAQWSLYFDGSAVGLTKTTEDVGSAIMEETGALLLSTVGAFSVERVNGTAADLLRCVPQSLGLNQTECGFDRAWSGAEHGFGGQVIDAAAHVTAAPVVAAAGFMQEATGYDAVSATPTEEADQVSVNATENEPGEKVYLPLIVR